MYNIRLLTTQNADEWKRLLEETEAPDIYFTPEYAKIYEGNYGHDINEAFCGPANLFYYGNDREFILYPFIKRKINELPFMSEEKSGEEVYDIVSHYGYSGVVIKSGAKNRSKLIKEFINAFHGYCIENNIITEFIRFHPLLNNHEIVEHHMDISGKNQTVYIDLTKSEDILFKQLNKKTRNLIRKAEKNEIHIERTLERSKLKVFTDLYLDTMKKNKAHPKYLFPLEFYEKTFDLLQGNVSLFVAKHREEIISAALFMHKYNFIHYHFSGSNSHFLKFAPNNLLIWKVILWGKQQGYKKFHLGGGTGEDDSLFHFKSGFSQDRARFRTSTAIHNDELYKKLCDRKDQFDLKGRKKTSRLDFFPYYRAFAEG